MAANKQLYRLKWNGFHYNLSEIFEKMLILENLVDCTVACDGASIKAHKLVLSAASPYFHSLFLSNPCKHPIVILKDVRFEDLKSIIDFIYRGEVHIPEDQLNSLLKTAETLRIRGLTEVGDKQNQSIIKSIPSVRHKKRKRKPNKSPNVQNNESQDSSEEENRNIFNENTFDNNLFNYNKSLRKTNTQKINENTDFVDNQIESNESAEDIEPTKILEQSMSTSENTNFEYSNEGVVVTSDVNLDLEDNRSSDIQEISLIEDKFYSNYIQYNDSFDGVSQMSPNKNQSTPQTIEEYEQLLAEIQRKKLTTCPICSKVFLKKSKLIRHYHTHFSSFRPKFSCVSCGKLFTTHDWCKRHQLSCNQKTSQLV